MSDKCCKKTSIGGQALIEGIMMRGPHKTVMACRKPDGTIALEDVQTHSVAKKHKILGLPVIRGAVNLVESLLLGYNTMMKSAEYSGMLDEDGAEPKSQPETEPAEESEVKPDAEPQEEPTAEAEDAPEAAPAEEPEVKPETEPAEESEVKPDAEPHQEPTAEAEDVPETAPAEEPEVPSDTKEESTAESASEPAAESQEEPAAEAQSEPDTEPAAEPQNESATADAPSDAKAAKKGDGVLMGVISVISGILGVALAILLFLYLPSKLFDLINSLETVNITPYKALFEGVFKIIIFLIYMVAVSQMKEIKRVFMYHGAEHKSIFCYEKGLELTVENVRQQKRFHPRCGTSFLILMLIVSILFYQILLLIPPVRALSTITWLWACIKLVMLPFICGLGYELIRFCGRHDNWLTRIISAPGMWVQRISTKEPDDSMIEVAIAALSAVIPENAEDDRW